MTQDSEHTHHNIDIGKTSPLQNPFLFSISWNFVYVFNESCKKLSCEKINKSILVGVNVCASHAFPQVLIYYVGTVYFYSRYIYKLDVFDVDINCIYSTWYITQHPHHGVYLLGWYHTQSHMRLMCIQTISIIVVHFFVTVTVLSMLWVQILSWHMQNWWPKLMSQV